MFAEAARVLKPGGVCIMSFSNRMFYDKAIAAWRDASDYAHVCLVKSYFQAVDGFGEPECVTQVLAPRPPALPALPPPCGACASGLNFLVHIRRF